MATIERAPLPPFGFGPPIKIAPTDRAELTKRAQDVVDHFLFGKGSWWDAGPRKTPAQTIEDLKRFKNGVVASRQFVDDPDSILSSIEELIDKAMVQVDRTITESKDSIDRRPPDPNDSIDGLPRSDVPATGNTAAARRVPIVGMPSTSFSERYRVPSLPIAPLDPDQQQSSNAEPIAPNGVRVLSSRYPMLNPGGVARGSPSQSAPNPSPAQDDWPLATRPLPDYPVPPSVYGLPDRDADIMDDWFSRWIKPLFPR